MAALRSRLVDVVFWSVVVPTLLLSGRVSSFALDISNTTSIEGGAKIAADGMMSYYQGNQTGGTPGILAAPYYWWEAGAAFGALVDYWRFTGNSEYVRVTTEAILWQAGPRDDFMPLNQTLFEGNDDQLFWAFAAMSAAENRFPDPPADGPSWLGLAEAVFNRQTMRWNTPYPGACGGGLRWQINLFTPGYNYKNSISNGGFFQLAARLGRYTGNRTYLDWAEKIWDWVEMVELISPTYKVLDGAFVLSNCTDFSEHQYTYNYGVFLLGTATMWNITGDEKWRVRTEGILNATSIFFCTNPLDIMYELICETRACSIHQYSFRGHLARWMARTAQLAPFTADRVMRKLRASAQAAAAQCSGGTDGVTCGSNWRQRVWDGQGGMGEQMSSLEVIQAILVETIPGPVTLATGGTGSVRQARNDVGDPVRPITKKDRVRAWAATVVTLVVPIWFCWFMV